MELAIQVYKIDTSMKYPKVYLTDASYVGCSKDVLPLLEVGKNYRVKLTEKEVKKKDGGTFMARDIVGIVEQTSEVSGFLKPSFRPTVKSVEENSIAENMKLKHDSIKEASELKARSVCIESAAIYTQALANSCAVSGAFAGMSKDDIRSWIKSINSTQRAENFIANKLELEQEF